MSPIVAWVQWVDLFSIAANTVVYPLSLVYGIETDVAS